MKRYNPAEIEPKWQKKWLADKTFSAEFDPAKPKKFIIDMFPYPSGAAMHVGHVRNFTISDVLSQYHRQQGYNVLHAMGWDTFGLPAENYAIKTGIHPAETTQTNIAHFKEQLSALGMSYDWSREINTSDPGYYRWTQWIFTKLFEQGLAYQAERAQWWCDQCKTVLANEQVVNGKCWRHDDPDDPLVEKKTLNQWFFKITDYADRLLEGVDALDWPEKIKTMQKNWIGKSVGAEVVFDVVGDGVASGHPSITVFTTRPDTLFGATFLVLAPEHERVGTVTTDEHRTAVETYVAETAKKSEIERQENNDKTGVFTGAYATNPITNEQIPIWVADYVLTGYGTGAIMAVPAHDERDNAFAKKFDLPIREVIVPDFGVPLENAENVSGVVVIGYDPKTQKYLTATHDGMSRLVSGGYEEGETYEQTAYRELREEAGFDTVTKMIALGGPVYSYYHNPAKNVDRRSKGYNFLAILDATTQGNQELEEAEKSFGTAWYDFDELYRTVGQYPGGSDHWIEGLNRAKRVVEAYEHNKEVEQECFRGDGVLVNSGAFDGIPSAEARELIVQHLEREGKGAEKTNYKIRDWLISRQRYWGAPIPIIHCPQHGAVAVPDDQLPVELPRVESFQPTGDGKGVLANVEEWVNTTCPTCGGPARRETDTMDGFACSSWYFLRYIDPHNTQQAWDPAKANYWLPVDYYCGGDHAVTHLLYARFWFYFFADQGWIDPSKREPVGKLVYNGYILAHDGNKMSKSKGNTVNPDSLIKDGYGADSVRLFEMFIAPYEQNTNWNTNGVPGTYRFLQRFWTLVQEFLESVEDTEEQNEVVLRIAHRAIHDVSEDLDGLRFNTAVSSLMSAVNALYKEKVRGFVGTNSWRFALESITQLLAPFAPHMSEELWRDLGHESSVHVSNWPRHQVAYLVEETVTIALQVNGKVRSEISVPVDTTKDELENRALQDERVKEFVGDKQPTRVIVVPGRLVNIVV